MWLVLNMPFTEDERYCSIKNVQTLKNNEITIGKNTSPFKDDESFNIQLYDHDPSIIVLRILDVYCKK